MNMLDDLNDKVSLQAEEIEEEPDYGFATLDILKDRQKLDQQNAVFKKEFKWTKDAHDILNEVFEYDHFRQNQEEAINCTMSNKDCLVLVPTGGGKSLIF